ncbi:Cysteine desulfurase IscS|nr:Cysteine desulfurase IscS [Neochlamydia sp. AcF84]
MANLSSTIIKTPTLFNNNMPSIYFDNSTTTRPSEKTVSKMLPFFYRQWGAPLAPHHLGQELLPAIEESLNHIYKLLNIKKTDAFVFTSSGAEAVNHVFYSIYHDVTRLTGKNQFITSNIEEAPATMLINRLEDWTCVGRILKANPSGYISPEAVADAITPRTALVSLAWANGLTGVINPIAEISAICQEKDVLLHIDATHVLGKLFFQLEDINPAFLTFNGDHLHAPKGTGGLYIKEGIKCSSFIVGGMDQGGKRAGTLNVPALVGLGEASCEALEAQDLMCTEVARLRDLFETQITSSIPHTQIFFQDQQRLPHISAIAFAGISNEALLFALNRKGVYASMGGGNFQQLKLILMASARDETLASSTLSFSFCKDNSEDEVMHAVEIIKDCVLKLRKLSSHLYFHH